MARTNKDYSSSGVYSKLNICNQALSLIGSERVQVTQSELNSPTTNTIAGQADLHYSPAIQELTRMHNWHCCLATKDLPEPGPPAKNTALKIPLS